ncbi:Meiotic recombination protein rdh54 [Neolecta irregularis DAH-3]|uniref:Meiotic recombination protein rdh54 n=1 Tax=Neolecta irregularis (strain DAH-3) TaxID=1198029 RepID=A0A1U7LUI6_NEOID|nr:Meiotic recombination protein rdh54 [Neolecta irregularis DAH-3]|eukprot:OLL26243.1 Meiotic recombination protein rdh54 [Neolecta irregularis DAH-3]
MSGKPFLRSSSNVETPILPQPAFPAATKFKNPIKEFTKVQKNPTTFTPRHDPTAENALVMPRPKSSQGKPVVDVVVDPYLSQKLRPHQREGVKFLYECIMGMKEYDGRGAVLADEMGLGKTLQTIALLWTLLKQNPFPNQGPIIKRALINWKREFRKWLGNERLGIFAADLKANVNDFKIGRIYQVMIIGYEKVCRECTSLTYSFVLFRMT